MPSISFICLHRLGRNPSQRFRFEQYIPFLKEQGFQCKILFLLNEKDDEIFYSTGNTLSKIKIAIKCFWKRLFQAITNKADIVFIHREAFITNTTLFERLFKLRSRMIYDFDDAIWMKTISPGNKMFSLLKNGNKIKHLIRMADEVITGNKYLFDYAASYNKNVFIIPSTVDTNLFKPRVRQNHKVVCIGWSGSFTTLPHFESVFPALKEIKEKYGDLIYFKVISNGNYNNEALDIKETKWLLQNEGEQLSEIDIGIMPLPDDEWCRGKCGLKGLVFMSMGIPVVMSPVGVNSTIIENGKNGLLASATSEWVSALSMLIESEELRKELAEAGIKTVLNQYSISANEERYLQIIQKLLP